MRPTDMQSPRSVLVLAIAVLLVLCASQSGQAQTVVPVRGGEHGAFTRLVMQLPEGTPWRVDQDARTVLLQVEAPQISFDLAETFARIPRLRIASVQRVDGPGVSISLACDCPVRVFEDLPGQVVIDVLNPPDSIQTVTEAPNTAPDPAANAGRGLAEALRDNTDSAARRPAETGAMALDRLRQSLDTDPPPDDTLREDLRADLSAAFSGAVESGLLAPAPPTQPDLPADEPSQTVSTAPVASVAALRDHIRIGPEDEALPSSSCLPEEGFALPDWGDDTDFVTRMAAHRGALLSEFDRPNPEAIAAKVRGYLYFGFGAEARALMRAFPEVLSNADLLRALSHIVDGETPPYPGRLARQQGCPTIGALWAVLAQPSGVEVPGLDAEALRRGFASLPAHLRQYLGPVLVDRLLALDDTETARIIRDSMARATGTGAGVKPGLAETDASILLHEAPGADDPEITAALEPGASPRALALLLSQQLSQGRAPAQDLVDLAEIVAAETRGTEMGDQIQALRAEALAAHGRFSEAFEVARTLGRTDAPAGAQLRRELLAQLVRADADEVFVANAFAERPWEEAALPPATALSLAERLVDLGFPSHARRMLDRVDPAFDAASSALLRARSHLVEAAPQAALDALGAMSDEEAQGLRQEALSMMGDMPVAAMPVAPMPEPSAPTAPLAEAADLSAAPAPSVAATQPAEGDSAGLLQRGQDALSSASDLRAGIAALLNEQQP